LVDGSGYAFTGVFHTATEPWGAPVAHLVAGGYERAGQLPSRRAGECGEEGELMSDAGPQGTVPQRGAEAPAATLPDGVLLAEHTREFAAQAYAAVAQEYLQFRQAYFHEQHPSLATVPPSTTEVQRTEAARLAEGALGLVPKSVRSAPLVGALIDHLQWEVDIHSLTERERTNLHNMAMIFLYGVEDGVQPWFVEWVAEVEAALQDITHPDYYLAYPWQAILYQPAEGYTAFAAAVAAGDEQGIVGEMSRLGNLIVEVLRDPLGMQPKLVFSGPDGDRQRVLFSLKTSAGLALAAYLAYDAVHALIHPNEPHQPPSSVIRSFPPQITARLLQNNGGTTGSPTGS
jgi:hypothetical protein